MNTEVFVRCFKSFLEQIKKPSITLDMDSSVMTRYGRQEEARIGYNPTKPGRPSHHPLIAFIPELRMVANAWLRPGDTNNSHNFKAFLSETLEIIGDKKIGLLRMDCGFSSDEVLSEIEQKGIFYITSMKLLAPIKYELLDKTGWFPLGNGVEIKEFTYKAYAWKKARRIVAVRKNIQTYRKTSKTSGKTIKNLRNEQQLKLFEEQIQTYRYSVFVTNTE